MHALYIRVRNLDNNKAMLQDFVKIMLPSIAEYIHIIDKLVVHVRKLFIDWRNKLWVALLNKYKELGNRLVLFYVFICYYIQIFT